MWGPGGATDRRPTTAGPGNRVAVAGAARPIPTDRERLWLAGLVAILVGAGAFGLLVGFPGPSAGVVSFHVADGEGLSDVTVRIERTDGPEPETVRLDTVDGGVDAVVYTTESAGRYRVRLSEAGVACTRTVRVRADDGLAATVSRPPDGGGDCPVSFSVETGSR
jgi:hypothetical protein